MKKFVNDPRQFVPEMLKGIALANPDTLRYVPEYNLIMRTDAPRDNKVSVIQGSGSGHEPAHVMIVGKGMLDAACPGDVFAAPPMDYVYGTSKLLASPKGVLHIINNYTGDRMAFEMGQEMAEADGVTIGTLIVDDDVAVKDSTYTVGRRGVAGNFFVIKTVGAASEQGADLSELLRIGNKVNSVTRTMGMALTSCTPPAEGSPLFELGDDEMEMGVGIHGEPGRRREKQAAGTYRKEADIGVACQSGQVFPLTEGMTGAVVARRAPVWFDRYDQVRGGHVAAADRATLRGVIGVPLEWRGRIIGACVVFSRDERRVFGPDDAELLELFARHAAIALATARMHEAAEERRARKLPQRRDRLLGRVHDGLAERLVSIRVDLDSAEGDLGTLAAQAADAGGADLAEATDRLRQAGAEARDALAEARLTLLGLASSPLNGQTLEAALEAEAAWAQSIGGLEVRFVTGRLVTGQSRRGTAGARGAARRPRGAHQHRQARAGPVGQARAAVRAGGGDAAGPG